ncbi:MAG: helicase C-terminal domain-containing protein [Alphaproteobacteria bacterium]
MAWNLYEGEKFLEPLKFSNGKTQEDIVKEVMGEIENGKKVIFIHGVCGSGKSGIALNLAREMGKTSIVVPGKNLQSQYKNDYENKKYLLKKSKFEDIDLEKNPELVKICEKEKSEKLKIAVITGRNNHICKFLEDDESIIPKITRETNATLHDIFGKEREVLKKEKRKKDLSADNWDLPCKIEIKEKNFPRIKQYLKKNQNIKQSDFNKAKEVRRMSVASICPYWSPVVSDTYELKGPTFNSAKKRTYEGLAQNNYVFYSRKKGCPFYEQFNSYLDSDVIVFNALKYKLETALNRKPKTKIEIIDECDEFLDSLTNQRSINLDRVLNSLNYVFSSEDFALKIKKEMTEIILHMKRDVRINTAALSGEIIPLKKTGIYDLIKMAKKNPEFFETIDEENYLFDFEETAKMFGDFMSETFVTFEKNENTLKASLVTTNLEKRFGEMLEKNNIFVLMSGTLHSKEVLEHIFGLRDFITIDAETTALGQIEVKKTGMEMDCRYANFKSKKYSREEYLRALSKSVEVAKKPCLVHVNAFNDLPSSSEIAEYDLFNLVDREKLIEEQFRDKTGVLVKEFKAGNKTVLFSTRASRGVDFPGNECNSIVFTKYPNPNVKDPFYKILSQTNPDYYWEFYRDKAKRELWQRVYRGVRSNTDHVYVLSPDSRVLDAFSPKIETKNKC